MPSLSLSAALDAKIGSIDVHGDIAGQVAKLGPAGTAVTALVQHPPQGLEDVINAIKMLAPPQLSLGFDLAGTFGSVTGALPGDLSSVTGDLTHGLSGLKDSVAGEFASVLARALDAMQGLSDLLALDFRCAGPGTGSPGAPGSPGGSPGAAPGGVPAGLPGGSGPTPVSHGLDQATAFFNLLPTPVTLPGLLALLTGGKPSAVRELLGPVRLPVIDDVRDAVATLVEWAALSPTDLTAHLAASLHAAAGFVDTTMGVASGPLVADLHAVASAIHADTLAQIVTGLIAKLGDISTAIAAGTIATAAPAVTAIGALLDQYAAVRPALATNVLDRLPSLTARMAGLPAALEDQVDHVVAVLGPIGALESLGAAPLLPAQLDPAIMASVTQYPSMLVGWLQDLLGKLDLSAITGAIQKVAGTLTTTIDGLENALVNVTLRVQQLFGEVEHVLDRVDVAAAVNHVKDAIHAFSAGSVGQVTHLLDPVKAAIHAAVSGVDAVVKAVDLKAIHDNLEKVLTAVTDVLGNKEVVDAIQAIGDALAGATHAIEAVSFSAVTQGVVDAINDITSVLEHIPGPLLTEQMHAAIMAVMSALPPDLKPMTDQLVTELGQVADQDLKPIIDAAKDPVHQLVERVKGFNPSALVGPELSARIHQLSQALSGFRPSDLLAPVDHELAALRDRLRTADPSHLLEPLAGPFATLTHALDPLDPEALIRPLDEAMQAAIASVMAAVPHDALAQVGAVLGRVAKVASTLDQVDGLVTKARDLLGVLGAAREQVATFAEPVLAKIQGLGDVSSVQVSMIELQAAVGRTKVATLKTSIEEALDVPVTALQPLVTGDPMAHLVRAYTGTRSAVDALPASSDKAAVVAVLDRFDPGQPAFAAPFGALTTFHDRAVGAKTDLETALGTWDARYHAPDGVLACVSGLQVTPANLTSWIRDAVAAQIAAPLRAALGLVAPIRAGIEPFLVELAQLTATTRHAVGGLVAGPQALTSLLASVNSVLDRLQHFNLGFLRTSLNDLFTRIKQKVHALDPAALSHDIHVAFEQMVSGLSLDLIIPAGALATLDQDVATVLQTLNGLDPQVLLQPLQQVYDGTVLPLLTSLDVSPLLQALQDKIAALTKELPGDLDQVNKAYQKMRHSVPSPSPISIDVSAAVGGFSL